MEIPRAHSSETLPQVPGYQFKEKIGEGGMGEVYRATQLSLNRTVAIKLLRPMATAPGELSIFQRESQLMAALAHPNVVTIHDCGQIDGHNYLVMELIKGASLRAHMQRGRPWTVTAAAPVLDAVAQALSYIHEQGILHLDLKPENVLRTDDGQIKISDFGLAVSSQDAGDLSEGAHHLGTIDYCAPEQRFGLALDARCDVFSLATFAYELLTGRLPGRVYVPASRRNPRLPPALDDVLRRGLERNPKDRYDSVAAFRTALASALHQRGPRRKLVPALLAAAALLAVVPVAWHWWPAAPQPAAQLPSSHPASTAASEPVVAVLPLRSWLLHDRPEDLTLLVGDAKEIKDAAGTRAKPLRVTGNGPKPDSDVPLPLWPTPGPVLVVSSAQTWGFVHPFQDASLAQRVLTHWPRFLEVPPRPTKENRVRAGTFDGHPLFVKGASPETSPWGMGVSGPGTGPSSVAVAIPRDRPGNPALLLEHTRDVPPVNDNIMCFQFYVSTKELPEADGTIMVLRYQARAESGAARLAIDPGYPWSTPRANSAAPAPELRRRSGPDTNKPSTAETDHMVYWLQDWVTPTSAWQTYYVIWESPPLEKVAHLKEKFGIIVIKLVGRGRVWVDDIEMFAWEPGRKP